MFKWFKCVIYVQQTKWSVVTHNTQTHLVGEKKCQNKSILQINIYLFIFFLIKEVNKRWKYLIFP